jgi:uncharacterized protein involved in exopolysaccharide biosynthesis
MKESHPTKLRGRGNAVFYFSLRDLVSMMFRRRRVIALSFVGVLAGAFLAIRLLPPTYEAEMKILVQRERVDPVVSTDANVPAADHGLTESEVTSEVELFQSRDSLKKAVVDCGLYPSNDPSFLARIKLRVRAALGKAPDIDAGVFQAVLNLEKDLRVIPLNESNLIKVTYASHSPQLAAQVLTELGDLYLSKHSAVHRPAGTADFFEQQAEQYKKDLESAENQLVGLSQQTGVVSPDVVKQATVQKLGDITTSLQQVQAAIAEARERLRGLREQEASGSPRITTQIRTSENSQLMASLKSTLLNLEIKRTELLQKYEPGYVLVQEVDTQISQAIAAIADAQKTGVREEITDQDPTHAVVRTEIAKTQADLVGLEARASAMSEALRTLQNKTLNLDQEARVQQDLQRVAKENEVNYLLYRQKHEEARIADALDQRRIVNAAITEAAMVPLIPVSLSLLDQLLLAFTVAGMLSLGLGLVFEYLDHSFRTPDEVEEYLGIPLFASLPKDGSSS